MVDAVPLWKEEGAVTIVVPLVLVPIRSLAAIISTSAETAIMVVDLMFF